MKVVSTAIPNVLVFEPRVFADHRGYGLEAFNQRDFRAATGLDPSWCQDNTSRSGAGVLRGIHFQNPGAQGKLVRCGRGSIYDVAVDLRRSSPTFLQWVGVVLDDVDHRAVWIPEGFGHGFLVTSDVADVHYKVTDYYAPQWDRGVRWDDPDIGIEWPNTGPPVVSAKDATLPFAAAADLFD